MSKGSILLVDDDLHVLKSTAQWLQELGFVICEAATLQSARQAIEQSTFDLVISDIRLEDGDGFELLQAAQQADRSLPVILVTGYGTFESAIEAIRRGAFDFLSKPLMDDELLAAIERALTHKTIQQETSVKGKPQQQERPRSDRFVTRDPSMENILEVVDTIADTRATVLVTGESGTGKSMIAREIHNRSERSEGPFVEVACGALSETLLESELFGHVKGAFTDARADKLGKFHQAEGGTIFLDEIATASPAMQVKLLRVLQELQFEQVGGTETFQVDTRVILATNEDLGQLVEQGKFREDLFYRINVIHLELPPLRDRRADIPLLAEFFLAKFSHEVGKSIDGFSLSAMELLRNHPLPGNIRELQNMIERAVLLGKSNEIQVDDLPAKFQQAVTGKTEVSNREVPSKPQTLKEALEGPERSIILSVLNGNNWNRNETAETLGINRTTLYKKMKKLGLEESRVVSCP